VGFEGPGDTAAWELDVVRPGRHAIALFYTCPPGKEGRPLEMEVGAAKLSVVVRRPHDPAPLPSPDRVPRGEVFEKEWASVEAGSVELVKGRTQLLVRPGTALGELKGVQVRALR
jgi:arylsulfatase A